MKWVETQFSFCSLYKLASNVLMSQVENKKVMYYSADSDKELAGKPPGGEQWAC